MVGAPAWFSFSPSEIRSFISLFWRNGPLGFDFGVAKVIVDDFLRGLGGSAP
jgi:hypothetical protein